MTIDGGSLAVSGLSTMPAEALLQIYMSPQHAATVMRNEQQSLEKASESARIKKKYTKRFAPETGRINKRLNVVHKEIAKIENQIYKTKDPNKIKELQEQRKPLAEESEKLRGRLQEITESMKTFEATDPKLARLKSEASRINLTNHNVLAAIARNDPETAGWLRSYIAEFDKTAEDNLAASSFIGVSYGAGGFGIPGMLPGMAA